MLFEDQLPISNLTILTTYWKNRIARVFVDILVFVAISLRQYFQSGKRGFRSVMRVGRRGVVAAMMSFKKLFWKLPSGTHFLLGLPQLRSVFNFLLLHSKTVQNQSMLTSIHSVRCQDYSQLYKKSLQASYQKSHQESGNRTAVSLILVGLNSLPLGGCAGSISEVLSTRSSNRASRVLSTVPPYRWRSGQCHLELSAVRQHPSSLSTSVETGKCASLA